MTDRSPYDPRVLAHRAVWTGTIDLLVIVGRPERIEAVATNITMRKIDPSSIAEPIDPTLRLRPDAAQELMDELWRCGLRPTEGMGSAGSLAATQRHLEDMRSLVFHHHGIEAKR